MVLQLSHLNVQLLLSDYNWIIKLRFQRKYTELADHVGKHTQDKRSKHMHNVMWEVWSLYFKSSLSNLTQNPNPLPLGTTKPTLCSDAFSANSPRAVRVSSSNDTGHIVNILTHLCDGCAWTRCKCHVIWSIGRDSQANAVTQVSDMYDTRTWSFSFVKKHVQILENLMSNVHG